MSVFLNMFRIFRPAVRLFPDDFLIAIKAIKISPPRYIPRPLTSSGRCQALGGVSRCRPYMVWASLHVPMLRFYVGSPYHVGPASAHSSEGLASADRSEGSRGVEGGEVLFFFIFIKHIVWKKDQGGPE